MPSTFKLIGSLMYHELKVLVRLKNYEIPVVIVVVNNNWALFLMVTVSLVLSMIYMAHNFV